MKKLLSLPLTYLYSLFMNASDAVDKHRHYDIVKGQKSFFVECVSIYYLLTILFFVQIVEKKLGHISESDQKNIDNK